jgi:hypothetical protein
MVLGMGSGIRKNLFRIRVQGQKGTVSQIRIRNTAKRSDPSKIIQDPDLQHMRLNKVFLASAVFLKVEMGAVSIFSAAFRNLDDVQNGDS